MRPQPVFVLVTVLPPNRPRGWLSGQGEGAER